MILKKEINLIDIIEDKIITKIKILIDMEVKSITKLFKGCPYIKEIKFIKFNWIDFTDFCEMFSSSKHSINLDISKLKTDNIENMESMFNACFSLKV